MKKHLSKIVYTALCLVACATMVACAALYEPVPGSAPKVPGATNSPALVQPSAKLVDGIKTTGGLFGPYGDLAAGAAVLVLQAGSYYANKKALADHVEEFHASSSTARPIVTSGDTR